MPRYNLTAAEINGLSDDDARNLLGEIATKLFGSDRWATDLATQLGVTRQAVQQWKSGGRRPPTIALVAVSAILRAAELDQAISGYVRAHETLTQLGASPGRP